MIFHMPGIDLIDNNYSRSLTDVWTLIQRSSQQAFVIRSMLSDCALAGADIATVPYAVIEQMTKHPLTDQGIEKFQKDYKAVFGE